MVSYRKLQSIFKNELCPLVFVDLKAFDENLSSLCKEMKKYKKTVRIGTKSLRVPYLIKRALKKEMVPGLLLFHPNELQFWQEKNQVRDFLLAYPVANRAAANLLSEAKKRDNKCKVTTMVDCEDHLTLLESSAAANGVNLSVCIDVDMSTSFFGQYAGVYRSPLRNLEVVVSLARSIETRDHLSFRGIMGYEAQMASVGDDSFVLRKMKSSARTKVNTRRQEAVKALKNAGFDVSLVNGGGSGCFQETAVDPSITEIGLGSALFKSHIFDAIESMSIFKPSAFMALRIVRKPKRGVATAFSGGYICSGTNLPPIVHAPTGVEKTKREGFGEVQTPFRFNPKKSNLSIGDLVICRLAKAGEPMERFCQVYLIKEEKLSKKVPTYRGVGLWLG